MTAALVTVRDSLPFSASVSPEQAAAYVRRKLPGWRERVGENHFPAVLGPAPVWLFFDRPGTEDTRDRGEIAVPLRPELGDYSRRMAELCDALVVLGCADRPSEALRGMAEEKT